ncbi:MAG TPA: PAS domain S-box protein, partial [Candidatus Saccharimonadales bacterium]|nr:PAS domain S-box protein [Candidatus Saccharimonadales bacterium]
FATGNVSHHEIQLEIDGEERHIYATSMPIKALEGGVEQTIVMLQDVSDLEILRRSEEALRASEARFRSIFEKTTAGMATVAVDGTFLQVNPAMCRFLGYPESELLTLSVQEVTHPEDIAQTRQVFSNTPGSEPECVDLEKRYLRKDGTTVWGRTSAAWIRGASGRADYSVALVQDITERKHLEYELRQAEKMSAVGQLIAGVAHELNNPLAGVLGYAQLLLDVPGNERIRRGLESINREADRCKKIVHNLQTFARKHKPEVEEVDLNAVLMSTLELRAYQMKVDNIDVVADLDEDLPVTLADAHQLRQVFLNVIINAHQAMTARGGRGRLTLRTRRKGHEISIEISDNGPGIGESVLGKIFDPFFTTKEVGQGTGLGLSICYGIVNEHGGRITADNLPEGGARFILTFPVRAPGPVPVPAASPRPAAARHGAGARILVVDDERSVRDVLTQGLEAAGHRVDAASNGTEALAVIEKCDYDLIISDLKMPGMSGQSLFDSVCRRKPAMARRFVFSTGDTVSSATMDFLDRTGARCVPKPFDLREVRRVVEEFLAVPAA